MNIHPLDFTAMYGDVMGGNPDYDLLLSWWVPDYPSGAASIQLRYDSSVIDGGSNFSRYSSSEVDAMMKAALAEADPDAAAMMWGDIDQRIMQDAPTVPLFYTRSAFLGGSNVTNYFVPRFPSFQNYLKISLGE
ncbi:hypothetical protein PU630_15720 [Microbacterium horticulturae]|uniref:Peptide/nickel transport system substrate-binding protein n=1 Tax=Microbacterium horticulturae TaxID=3028316 RepID=A0ABY8BYX7_9MICO|nr:hypothetical protein [Microbacterium sp. KACC 23027]WEG08672.1 hypothetical protein PU630_15720 [Microbacterium sp. KACC 23027]